MCAQGDAPPDAKGIGCLGGRHLENSDAQIRPSGVLLAFLHKLRLVGENENCRTTA